MKSAGNIFSRMTNGDYRAYYPQSPYWNRFQATDEGRPADRQHAEQGTQNSSTFGRLSRIMDIKPCLPIIDDFANFDSLHLHQSIDILSELANTHQIFILTRHGNW